MFTSFFERMRAFFMSIILFFSSLFGFAAEPEQPPEVPQIKNVIYMIGDGMGFNHLEKTKLERDIDLVMETFPLHGSSETRSLSSAVTDSAAGGTALATGSRTGNGMIGVYYEDAEGQLSYPKNLTELCMENGKMTGIVTTDSTSGATPAAFSAHESSRDNKQEITDDQLASGFDLIWGKSNKLVTQSIAQEHGFIHVDTYSEMMSLEEGSRSFGQFTQSLWKTEPVSSKSPNLEQMATKAVDLLDDTDEGFFLMIEGAHIDKHSHDEDGDSMVEALVEFDRTVAAMLAYAEADGEIIVIITADHETGGLYFADGAYVYKNGNHSGANVPVFVYGSEKIIAQDETLRNYEIPIRIARVLGFDEEEFPIAVKRE